MSPRLIWGLIWGLSWGMIWVLISRPVVLLCSEEE